jgi:hypothetical protein
MRSFFSKETLMTCYIVTFEVDPARKASFKERLKTYSNYCPIHDTCWAILTEKTAAQVRDHLTAALDPTDRLFVLRSGTEAAWRNSYGEENNAWLKKYL